MDDVAPADSGARRPGQGYESPATLAGFAAKLVGPGLGVLGLAMSLWPMLRSSLRLMPTDPGDTRLNNYLLEHGYRWLQGTVELWNPAIFFPVRGSFAFGDVLLGSAPIYWTLRASGFQPDTAYQLWIGVCLVLDYGVMWLWLARGLRLGAGASAGGAFLFAFGSTRIAQLNHQQLLPQFFTVLALHAATRLFEGPRGEVGLREPDRIQPWGWIAVGFACLALQIYAGFYLGWFALLGVGILLAWALGARRLREPLLAVIRVHWMAIVVSAALCGLALAPLATRYREVGREFGYRQFAEIEPMLPRLPSWLYLGPESWLYSWQASLPPWQSLLTNPYRHEHAIGIGLVTLALAVWGLLRRQPDPRLAALARLALRCWASVFVAVTLFAPGATPWSLLFPVVPGASAIRAISRVSLLCLVPASLGLALALRALHARPLLVALALACVVAEQGRRISFYDKQATRELVSAIAEQVRASGCAAFYYSPILAPTGVPLQLRPMRTEPVPWAHPVPYKYQLDAMWAQIETGVPTLNGYSGKIPDQWMRTLSWNQIASQPDRERIRAGLQRWISLHSLAFDLGRCWIQRIDLDRESS